MARSKQRFSKQKGGQARATIAALKKRIMELSGGDEGLLLQAIVESYFGKDHAYHTSIEKPTAKTTFVSFSLAFFVMSLFNSYPFQQQQNRREVHHADFAHFDAIQTSL